MNKENINKIILVVMYVSIPLIFLILTRLNLDILEIKKNSYYIMDLPPQEESEFSKRVYEAEDYCLEKVKNLLGKKPFTTYSSSTAEDYTTYDCYYVESKKLTK